VNTIIQEETRLAEEEDDSPGTQEDGNIVNKFMQGLMKLVGLIGLNFGKKREVENL